MLVIVTTIHKIAIAKYGLSSFIFKVVEFCSKELLLSREQHYLYWLFLQPAAFRYNFLQVAGSSLGFKHSEESKAKMRGRTHSEESKAKISSSMLGKSAGKNNPMFGKIPPNRVGVHVFDLEGNVSSIFSFSGLCSQVFRCF